MTKCSNCRYSSALSVQYKVHCGKNSNICYIYYQERMAFCLYSISILLEYGLVSILVRTVMSCIQRNFIRRPCNWTKKDPAIWFLSIMHMLGALCLRMYSVIRDKYGFSQCNYLDLTPLEIMVSYSSICQGLDRACNKTARRMLRKCQRNAKELPRNL